METYDVHEYAAAVSAELRAERGAQELTFAQLAARTGMYATTLIRYFKGERDIPVTPFTHMCMALGVEPAEIMRRAMVRVEREAQQRDGGQ